MPQNGSVPPSVTKRTWGFSSAGRVFFGWGVLEELRNIGQEFGRRIMVCTDQNIVRSGIAERVEALLRESGAEVFMWDGGRPEVNLKTIDEAAEVMQVSHSTVEREWKIAKAWLKRELTKSEKPS